MNSRNYHRMAIATSLTTILIIGLLCAWIAPVSAQGYWTALKDTPANVEEGGALVYADGNLYALRGDEEKNFWRYNIATNKWTPMKVTPAGVGEGGALASGSIYALRGDDEQNFWKFTFTHAYASTSTGSIRNSLLTSENVYVIGSGFKPGKTVDIYITNDHTWTDAMSIPTDVSSDGVNTVTTNGAGDFGPILVWPAITTPGEYDIVIDTDQDKKYSLGIDHVNDPNHPGFSIVEYDPSSAAVGGFYLPASSFAILLPYLALISLLGIVATVLVKRNKSRN
jgi:outer membrane protein assembly factor BamB